LARKRLSPNPFSLEFFPNLPISLLMKGASAQLTRFSVIMPSEPTDSPKNLRGGGRQKAVCSAAPDLDHQASSPPKGATSPVETLGPGERKSRALLNSLSDLVFSVRKDGVILDCHLPKETAYGLTGETVIGRRVIELLPIQIGQQAMHYVEKALRTGLTPTFACPHLVSGKTRDFEAKITASGPSEVVVVVRDVTARKLAEQEVLEISNREQIRIGQDLHDGLGQHLTGITFLTKALEKKLAALSLPETEDAAEIGRLVLQALSQTRNLARGLFPVELESSELAAALRELATTVEKLFSITCLVESDEHLVIRNRTILNHLFRLAQEAINNSVKHGKAKRVVIGLKGTADLAVLTIRDNGSGFRRESANTKGLGLKIMSYRAQKIGAIFEIQAGENGGTVVTCSLPNPLKEDCV
jgi:PAS domain S-box-containing protein